MTRQLKPKQEKKRGISLQEKDNRTAVSSTVCLHCLVWETAFMTKYEMALWEWIDWSVWTNSWTLGQLFQALFYQEVIWWFYLIFPFMSSLILKHCNRHPIVWDKNLIVVQILNLVQNEWMSSRCVIDTSGTIMTWGKNLSRSWNSALCGILILVWSDHETMTTFKDSLSLSP